MRVIAGQAKGCKLVAPDTTGTRPTPDRVKEALFSMWHSMGVQGRGLDAYAGSGAIGIEALSRGATSVVFVESDVHAVSALQQNLARLPEALQRRATVVTKPLAEAAAHHALGHEPFDWVFVDPPFAAQAYEATLHLLQSEARLADDASIVLEHAKAMTPPASAGWTCERTRAFGSVALSFYRAPPREKDAPLVR